MQWVVCFLLKSTYEKREIDLKDQNRFDARNETQVYSAYPLSLAFMQTFALEHFYKKMQTCDDPKLRRILEKLFQLYGLWIIDKYYTTTLYQGGYISGPLFPQYVREVIPKLCKQLLPEAISLIDAIATPDFILNSVLGKSDGRVYENLKDSLFSNPRTFLRPEWWSQIINKNLKSKI